jgi:hypothetical protein
VVVLPSYVSCAGGRMSGKNHSMLCCRAYVEQAIETENVPEYYDIITYHYTRPVGNPGVIG